MLGGGTQHTLSVVLLPELHHVGPARHLRQTEPLEDGRDIAEAAPNGRLVVLPGAPHNGLWANPETKAALEREIAAFLDAVLLGPAGP